MNKIIIKILTKLKNLLVKVKKELHIVFCNNIKSKVIQKKLQLQDDYKRRMERKREILSFQVREAFNKIRINIDALSSDNKRKCILISSPSPADRKTTICCYLARYMAQFGKKTLIIDCNIRDPKMSVIFGANQKNLGLSDILTNDIDPQKSIVSSSVDNLYIITSGSPIIDPVGLLGCYKMNNLIESLTDEFDYILLDTPSILLVPDTIALAKHIANIYLVVRHNYTKNQDIINALDALSLINRSAKGIIYNDAPSDRYDRNFIYN